MCACAFVFCARWWVACCGAWSDPSAHASFNLFSSIQSLHAYVPCKQTATCCSPMYWCMLVACCWWTNSKLSKCRYVVYICKQTLFWFFFRFPWILYWKFIVISSQISEKSQQQHNIVYHLSGFSISSCVEGTEIFCCTVSFSIKFEIRTLYMDVISYRKFEIFATEYLWCVDRVFCQDMASRRVQFSVSAATISIIGDWHDKTSLLWRLLNHCGLSFFWFTFCIGSLANGQDYWL